MYRGNNTRRSWWNKIYSNFIEPISWMQFIALIDHHYDYFMSVNRTRHMKSVHIVSGHKLGYFKKRGDAIISQILECALKGGGTLARKHVYAAVRAPNKIGACPGDVSHCEERRTGILPVRWRSDSWIIIIQLNRWINR